MQVVNRKAEPALIGVGYRLMLIHRAAWLLCSLDFLGWPLRWMYRTREKFTRSVDQTNCKILQNNLSNSKTSLVNWMTKTDFLVFL